MPAPRPLPRSLIPIPGESLPGFLLRLSFRLGLPPSALAEATGLAPAGRGPRLPAVLLTGSPEAASSAFASMTRLTSGQAEQLGLAAWQGRYPMPAAGAGRRPLASRRVLAPATRYCPECLAGDGAAIQESLGGPWLKAWHLPVVFACPAHRRLLEHLCPECGQPVHGRRPGAYPTILPAMRAAGLHPAQCRTERVPARRHHQPVCCGTRLDQAGNRRPADPRLTALQGKILDLLDPGGTVGTVGTISAGMPATPAGYFADLHELGLLACWTWPAARHLAPSPDTASAIDEHVASLRRQDTSPGSAARVRFDPPPADAAASAGLACIADRVLGGSTGDVREFLRQFLPPSPRKANRTYWGLRVLRSEIPCSEGMQAAYDPLLRNFTRPPRGRRNAVLRPERWGPENIPAFLPRDWHDRHFTPIAGVNDMFVRRTATLRLVQMVAGGSLGEAAGFLGIASTDTTWEKKARIYSGAGFVHTGASRQPDPQGFETALSGLARELDDPARPLVNYQRRRHALQTWCIDEDAWAQLAGRLPPVPGPHQPELGDRKRQVASIYVWVQVTSGEHYFAPRPIEAAQSPQVQEAWKERRNNILHLINRSRPSPHYTSLKAELNTLATSLARSIDNDCA
jgi:hypothetical protein